MNMVSEQIEGRGVRDTRVLEAMRRVPRHEFVGSAYRQLAYDDSPLPIEDDQTISQPYIVALMTELADVQPGEKVLEVGTGSGYQAAVLSALGADVYSIEIVPGLAQSARMRLERLGYAAHVRHGDGYAGWPEHAPFAAILITAAPPSVPQPLSAQLAVGGRLVVPVGEGVQDLWVWTRTQSGLEKRNVLPVRFVPMTGRAQQRDDSERLVERSAPAKSPEPAAR
jgi:protein-L-isoaspartate(D-aspartate) O-methyltransferase